MAREHAPYDSCFSGLLEVSPAAQPWGTPSRAWRTAGPAGFKGGPSPPTAPAAFAPRGGDLLWDAPTCRPVMPSEVSGPVVTRRARGLRLPRVSRRLHRLTSAAHQNRHGSFLLLVLSLSGSVARKCHFLPRPRRPPHWERSVPRRLFHYPYVWSQPARDWAASESQAPSFFPRAL